MAKSELKTKQTDASVDAFLDSLADEQQRDDSRAIVEIMLRITGEKPKMWGPAIIGFGSTTLKYSSGRELDWMKLGFSSKIKSDHLHPVTDAKDGNVDLFVEIIIHPRSIDIGHTRWAARQNHSFWSPRGYFIGRKMERVYLTINALFANSASDQLRILRAKIEDYY